MKKLLFIALSAGLLATACSKEESVGLGSVEFTCEPDLQVEALTRATVQLPSSVVPAASGFKLTIAKADDSAPLVFNPFSTYDQPQIEEGNYTATFEYGNLEAESAKAYCYKGSTSFTVRANRTTSVIVRPQLVNSAITLKTGEWFDKYYTDARFTVTTSSGNSFLFTPTSRPTIFVKAGTTLKLKGTAVKSQNEVDVIFPEAVIGTTRAKALHTITVEASQAGEGAIRISLGTVDEMTEVTPIIVELNPEA